HFLVLPVQGHTSTLHPRHTIDGTVRTRPGSRRRGLTMVFSSARSRHSVGLSHNLPAMALSVSPAFTVYVWAGNEPVFFSTFACCVGSIYSLKLTLNLARTGLPSGRKSTNCCFTLSSTNGKPLSVKLC